MFRRGPYYERGLNDPKIMEHEYRIKIFKKCKLRKTRRNSEMRSYKQSSQNINHDRKRIHYLVVPEKVVKKGITKIKCYPRANSKNKITEKTLQLIENAVKTKPEESSKHQKQNEQFRNRLDQILDHKHPLYQIPLVLIVIGDKLAFRCLFL